MTETHLTRDDIERHIESNLDDRARAGMDQHLAACATCHARLTRAQRVDAALRALPRMDAPRDLAARISAAVEARTQAQSSRAPFIAAATVFSALLVVWFGFELLIAVEDKNAVEFLAWIFSHPELFTTNFADTALALVEIIPIAETLLTLFALFTVLVLAQQWIEAIAPRAPLYRNERGS